MFTKWALSSTKIAHYLSIPMYFEHKCMDININIITKKKCEYDVKGSVHNMGLILGPPKIQIFLYYQNQRQK